MGRPPSAPGEHPDAEIRIVSEGYFAAMRIPVVAGREITVSDTRQTPPVMIINDVLARHYFLDESTRVVATGVVAGLVAAALLTTVLRSILYGVGTHDPLTLVAVPALIGVVGLIAAAVPAHRATRVDPLVSMRAE